jgi:CubicO group peptidase (beta-lactamase class C family)
VSREPGKNWLYSGGGYGVLQLLIEEVTQRSFGDYMAEAVLQPLGMTGASFEWEAIVSQGRADDLATNFDAKLKPQPHRRYSVTAAASLYATPQDMVAFAQAYTHPNPVLKPETLAQMMMPQPGAYQDWGLGQILYAANGAGGYVVGHDGNNLPAMSHTVRINPATGNALILMTVGNEGLANQLGDDWVYWETGILSTNARMNHILQILQTGLFGIMGSWFFPSYGQVERETPRW